MIRQSFLTAAIIRSGHSCSGGGSLAQRAGRFHCYPRLRRVGAAGAGWGALSSVTQGACASPLQGTAISGTLTCTVTGLTASTAYDFQLIAFRGTMNQGATYGELSNTASATTLSGQTVPSTDVNNDGATNITDVQLAINQTLGLAACGNGDVNGDGACTVTDIQRIVNAALGLGAQ